MALYFSLSSSSKPIKNLTLCVGLAFGLVDSALADSRTNHPHRNLDIKVNPVLLEPKISGSKVNHPQSDEDNKLDGFLSEFVAQTKRAKTKSQNSGSNFVRTNAAGNVQIYVTLDDFNQIAIQELEELGLNIEVASESLNKVQGWVAPDTVLMIANLVNVKQLSIPSYAFSNKGSVTTAGVQQLQANELAKLGHTGKGVKVGIVSNGANDWRTAAASGDLPERVTVYGSCTKRSSTGSTQNLCSLLESSCNEGTAMAEIIHDIAPDADLAIAAVSTSLEFVNQIERLINEFNADIIVDDLGFLGEPTHFDGDIARAIDGFSKRVLFVSSAGNSGYGHYRSNYRYSNANVSEPINGETIGYYVHDFDSGSRDDAYHGYLIPPGSAATVVLKWDARVGFFQSRTGFRLRIHNRNGELVYRSEGFPDSDNDGIAGVCIPNQSDVEEVYFATVELDGGSTSSNFQLFFFSGGAIEYPYSPASIYGHPALERVVAVGAINAASFNDNQVAFYSSQGPARLNKLDEFGRNVGNVVEREKPDIVASDGVSVTGAGGFRSTFFGTSAAAPHVAGIAAQLMSVSPLVTAENTRAALTLGARDIGIKGHDDLSGYGIADALGALENIVLRFPLPGILMLLNDEG